MALNGNEIVWVQGVTPTGMPTGILEQTTTLEIADLGGGGGGGNARLRFTITTNTTAGAIENTDYVYFINGTATLTLPSASGNNNRYSVKNIGTGVATVGATIDGQANYIMTEQYQAADFISNNTDWNIF